MVLFGCFFLLLFFLKEIWKEIGVLLKANLRDYLNSICWMCITYSDLFIDVRWWIFNQRSELACLIQLIPWIYISPVDSTDVQ